MNDAAREILETLTPPQCERLTALYGQRHGLPWRDGDDELRGSRLVHVREDDDGDMTELNNLGWSVAMIISKGG